MLICDVLFSDCAETNAWILAGLRMLNDSGEIKVRSVKIRRDFYSSGDYSHRAILELHANGKNVAFDTGNGYQSFHRKDVLDRQADRLDAYFKSNFDPLFHAGMRNEKKFHPFVAGFFSATCKGNYYYSLRYPQKWMTLNLKKLSGNLWRAARHLDFNREWNLDNFESAEAFDSYELIYWSRVNSLIYSPEYMRQTYPYLSKEQTKRESEAHAEMINSINTQRIECFRALKEHFGDRIIGGIQDSEDARKICPDLITTDERVAQRKSYLAELKGNCVGIISKGHQYCLGARCGELLAAGRAMLSDKQIYTMPGDFAAGRNYVEYGEAADLVDKAEELLGNVDRIHELEKNNRKYYTDFFRPDAAVRNALREVFPEQGL